jgi:drug/metabolite transporter superfamily protein YnfA
METFNTIINFIVEHKEFFLSLPFIAIALSALQQKVNKWFKVQSNAVKVLIQTVLSSLPIVFPLVLGFIQANPALLGSAYGAIFIATTWIYQALVKPFSAQLLAFREYKASLSTDETPVTVPVATEPVITPEVDPAVAAFRPRVFQG